MNAGRWLTAIALAAIVLIAAGVVALHRGVPGHLLADWASARLGRTLALDGPVSIRIGRTLRLSADGLRLANAAWGSRPDMLVVRRLVLEVDAWSLVHHPVLVRRIEVDGFDLLLERNRAGAGNGDLDAGTPRAPLRWPGSLPLVVERIALPGARVRFAGPRLERPLDLHFTRFEQRLADGSMLALVVRGSANGVPLELALQAGPVDALLAGRDIRAVIDGRLGELQLASRWRIDDLARPVDSQVDLQLDGPDAGYVAARLGVSDLGTGPMHLVGKLRPAGAGRGVRGEVAGSLGAFTLQLRAEVANPAAMEHLALDLDVAGPDLAFAGGLAGIDHLPPGPFRLRARVERAGTALEVHEAQLALDDDRVELSGSIGRLDVLAGNDLRFHAQGTDLARYRALTRLPADVGGPFDLAGALRSSRGTEVLSLQAATSLGKLRIDGPLGRHPAYHGTRVELALAGPSLRRIGRLVGTGRLPEVAFTARGAVEWRPDGVVMHGIALRAGADALDLDGRLARDPSGPGTDLRWQARGEDLGSLARTLGIGPAPAGEYALQGRLRRERGATRLDDVRGTIAGATVQLAGRVADEPRRGTRLELALQGPRLEAFAPLLPQVSLPRGPFRVAGGLDLARERLVLRKVRFAADGLEGRADLDLALPTAAARGRFDLEATGADLARYLPQLGRAPRQPTRFDLKLRGAADGRRWNLDEARLDTGLGRLAASGQLDWHPDFSATVLALELHTPDLAAAGSLLGLALPAQPLELAARFSGTPVAFHMEEARGRLGGADFAGRVRLDLTARPVVDLDLRSDLLDLTPWLALVEPRRARAPRRGGALLVPAAPVPLAWLDLADATLDVRARRALVGGFAFDDLRLAARVHAGALELDALELRTPPDGRVAFAGSIRRQGEGASITLEGHGTQVALARLADTRAQRATRPHAHFDLALAGEGRTWRELAQSLDGSVQLLTGAGTLPASSADMLMGDFAGRIFDAVRPGAVSHRDTQVRCAAAFVKATGGNVRTLPALVLQTDKVNLVSHGTLSLASERIDFGLRTVPVQGLRLTLGEVVNPYVKVAGTLASPTLVVDPKGTLVSGGIAVATSGISILAKGLWDRLLKADDPCAAAAAEATKLGLAPFGPG